MGVIPESGSEELKIPKQVSSEQEVSKEKLQKELKVEYFYKKYFTSNVPKVKVISLEVMKELRSIGITAEQFLDYLCEKHGLLLHGSVRKIDGNKLISRNNKIFAADKSAIAIMRSLYSNAVVNLEYPYFINSENPLVLKIHTQKDGKFVKVDKGFVYVVNGFEFKNNPEDSWQFIKESKEVEFSAVIETEGGDFTYPVEFFNDFDLEEWNNKLVKEQK